VMDLNLKSAFLCAQALAPSMMERKEGAIINVSPLQDETAARLAPFITQLLKADSLFYEGSGQGTGAVWCTRQRSFAGVVDTAFHETFSTPEMMRGYVAAIPLGRVGTPAEVAHVIAFLASGAACFLAGETIEINGGMLML